MKNDYSGHKGPAYGRLVVLFWDQKIVSGLWPKEISESSKLLRFSTKIRKGLQSTLGSTHPKFPSNSIDETSDGDGDADESEGGDETRHNVVGGDD